MKKECFKKNAEYYDLLNKNKNYELECNFLEQVFKKYSQFEIKNILDLGCGTGIHAKSLSLRGYNVLGLDLSEEMIKIAKLKASENLKFIVGDMSNFEINMKFDSIISMFSSFGYLTKNKQIESSLNSIKKHLKPGGLFILDCWNGLGVMNELPSIRTKESHIGDLKISRTSYPKLDSLNHLCDVKFDTDVFKNNQLIDTYEELHKVRFFFPQEIKKYIEDIGFEIIEICKTFELGTKIDESDWDIVFITRLK